MKKKIAIIGHFGGHETFVDGQTVKTKVLYEELRNATNWDICILDTYYKDKKPIRLFFKLLHILCYTRDIIVLLSGNGMRFFFPILYFYSIFLHGNVYHDVIGGNLSQYVIKYPKFRRYLNSFRVNWVETKLLKKELEDVGINNAQVLVNFRRKKPVDVGELKNDFSKPFRFCTFSRVSKEKGIEEAVKAIIKINTESEDRLCELDIYGPIDESYKNEFERLIMNIPDYISYCGTVSSDAAVETLRNYYATLFPTYWEGEGNAGTVTESQFAGIPVIATDWRCNSEMIKSGIDGVIYPGIEAGTLEDAILWLIDHNDEILDIKRNSLKEAQQYLPEQSVSKIINFIQS